MKKESLSLVQQCLIIAQNAHGAQVDKGGEIYILHPLLVSMMVKAHERSLLKRLGAALSEEELEQAQAVALLHDVLEDCPITYDDLLNSHHLPKAVCDAVLILSKTEGQDYFTYLERVKANKLSRIVKLADLLDNANLDRLPKVTEEDRKRKLKYQKAMLMLWQD